MGIATSPLQSSEGYDYSLSQVLNKKKLLNSMSQEYHTGVFSFLNGFERSQEQQQQPQITGPQIRRDKLRVQGFEAALPLVGIEEEDSGGINPVYETAGMLSEMFNFPTGGVTTATELLENQISQSYRNTRPSPLAGAAASGDWFLNRQGMVVGGGLDPLVHSKNQTVVNDTAHIHRHHQQQQQQQQISSINAGSAAVMQLFLRNPQQQRSPSPSSSHPHPQPPPTSTLHMLLPNPSPSSSTLHGFHSTAPGGPEGSFGTAWVSGNETNPIEIPGLVEGQGLSLSLSSSLQHLEAAKAEELRMGGDGGMLYFGQGGGSAPPQYQFKNMTTGGTGGGVFHLQSGVGHNHQLQVGLGSSIGAFNMLRNSKYAKAAQELLEEFCSVGRGQFKKKRFSSKQNNNTNPSPNPPAGISSGGAGSAGGGNSSSTSKDLPPLSTSDRLEHQRRKVKLLSMLDEVDRRYNHYCDQMQMVVNSFDMVMGFGAAVPYTCLAQKAMSRHFRCLKEAVSAQLKHSCEVLGEKDAGSSGITKGETPRLRILEQSLRQQRAFHQMGIMEQEAWRPQRGLPERSVNILRAWLFEHFLHPYPSDADKHLLARQTGLSRNQVSNWFINARVRLWKPMVEDMYQQESKDGTQDQDQDQDRDRDQTNNNAQTPTPNHAGNGTATTTTAVETPTTTSSAITQPGKVSEFNALESDPSFITINDQCSSENQAKLQQNNNVPLPSVTILSSSSPSGQSFPVIQNPDTCRRGGPADYPTSHHPTNADIKSTLIRFGASTGDVSLTLGLRHAGNMPEKRQFSVDFGGC